MVEVKGGGGEGERKGGGVWAGGWGGDSNADFHSSNPGGYEGQAKEGGWRQGVRVEGWREE